MLLGARHQVAGPYRFAQPLRDGFQQMVAHVVAQRVVDALERIEVHEQHGELLAAVARADQFALQRFQERLAVGDARQAVAVGQAPDLLFRALAFADVAHQAQHLVGAGGHQARLEVVDGVVPHQFIVDRADLLVGQYGLGLFQQAPGDVLRQHFAQVAARALFQGKGGVGVVALFVVEVIAILVEAEEGVRDGGQHGPVVGVGDAQAGDGVAGAQHVQHAVAQDGPVDGLGDEVRGALLVGEGDGLQFVAARDHDDGDGDVGVLGPDRATHGVAIHGRHVHVQQHQVGRHAAVAGQRLGAVLRFQRVEADLVQHFPHQQTHDGIVVRDQDQAAFGGEGRCHVRFPFPGWY